jgi:hypothetical protein
VILKASEDESLVQLGAFSRPTRTGFGGRVAFSKGQDNFYLSVQSIVAKAAAHVKFWGKTGETERPYYAPMDMVFPVIVLDGELFEAFHGDDQDEIELVPVGESKLQWRGSDDWDFMVPVDIVKVENLAEFAQRRFADATIMLDVLVPMVREAQRERDNRPASI